MCGTPDGWMPENTRSAFWRAVTGPEERGIMAGSLSARSVRGGLVSHARRIAAIALGCVVVACSSAPPTPFGGEPTLSSVPGTPSTATPASLPPATAAAGTLSGPHVDVTPAAVLLTEVGASRRLTALAFDAAGNPCGGSATWTSNDPATVAIVA